MIKENVKERLKRKGEKAESEQNFCDRIHLMLLLLLLLLLLLFFFFLEWQLLSGPLKTFMDQSSALGAEVASMSAIVERGFRAQRDFLEVVSKSKMPDQVSSQ